MGFALINRLKYFEGERIEGTQARLVGIASTGVAIEIVGEDQRYFVPH
jgi:hypothetical protein